jgi:hypothetical protein
MVVLMGKSNRHYKEQDEEKEFLLEIGQNACLYILQTLISKQLLDPERINDKDYILLKIKENTHFIEEMRIQVILFDDFRKSLKSELSQNRPMTAVILTAICIEHIINVFYQDLLSVKYNLEKNDITRALSTLKIPDKTGWFLSITTNSQITQELRQKIQQINSLRNKIVHYEATPTNIDKDDGTYDYIKKSLSTVHLDELESITLELQSELSELEHLIFPEYKEAIRLFEKHNRFQT